MDENEGRAGLTMTNRHSDEFTNTECPPFTTCATGGSANMELYQDVIDDDDYQTLKRCFSMKGKGRRPSVPSYDVATNRLLLQLYLIKEDGQTSFAELTSWLQTLVQHKSYTEGSVYRKVMTIVQTYPTLDPNKRLDFLSQEFDPDTLDPCLTSLGLTRLHLADVEPFTTAPEQYVRNKVVVKIEQYRSKYKEPHTFVTKWLKLLSTECSKLTNAQLKGKVGGVLKMCTRLRKDKKDEELSKYLEKPFLETSEPVEIESECSSCKDKDILLLELNNQLKTFHDSCKSLNSTNKNLTLEIDSSKAIISELQEDKAKLIVKIQNLNSELKNMKGVIGKLKDELKKESEDKEDIMIELNKVRSSSLYKDNFKKKRLLQETLDEKGKLLNDIKVKDEDCCAFKEEIGSLKKKLKLEQSLKSKYLGSFHKQKAINSDLSQMLSIDDDKINIREHNSSHRFSDNIRQTFYALQGEANVSASNCSKVVSTVAKCLFNSDLTEEDLPTQSTALNFVNEANVIAKEQVVDEIKNSDHFTYACDATSRDKVHYVEKHIYLSNGKTLSLGFSEIASDNADTLLERCIENFKELCALHCIDNAEEADDLMKDIIKKMKGLMTDRASVCKAFDAKMANYKDSLLRGEDASTLFLFCNAHFLLALSKATEDALERIEVGMGKLGRDASDKFAGWKKKETVAVRLIRMVASIIGPRCDERNGCRQEWLAYCSSKGIKPMFTSFRSNRFNNIFQNATALIMHRKDVKTFLTENVSHSNLKFESILLDLDDDRIINLISVISFFHIMFTEPYWQLMNSNKSYADFASYVKKMKNILSFWSATPFDVLDSTSVFDDFHAKIADSVVLFEFFKSALFDVSLFNDCLKIIAQQFECALDRQLRDFLEGGVFGDSLNDNVRSILQSCPLTNLTGERLFGDLDYCINKRRNASLHLRSTLSMWKHNRTAKWLRKQKTFRARKIIQKAIKHGPEYRKRYEDEKKEVKRKIKARIDNNKMRKLAKENQVKERKISVLNAIIDQGGKIASCKDDLDLIFSGPKAAQRLKDQIRYRHLINGEKISLKTGNKAMLYDRLLNHICNKD